MKVFGGFYFCVFSLFFVYSVCEKPYHVHFVDRTSSASSASSGLQNFLFRAGFYQHRHSTFDYNAVKNAIVSSALKSNISLPKDFYMIDINLMNLEMDHKDQKYPKKLGDDAKKTFSEIVFFDKNPEKGRFVPWFTYGELINATTNHIRENSSVLERLSRTYPSWGTANIPMRMKELRAMLFTDYGKPTVIVGHCDCGCDRTGELFGSYYLKYQGYSWEAVNKLNTIIAERPETCHTYMALQWYCLYLEYFEGNSQLNCIQNYPCSA